MSVAASDARREVLLVAGKDLRIERRSRVTLQQILPFGLIVLLLFAFALDPDRGVLARVAPGPVLGRRCCSPSLLAVGRVVRDRGGQRRARRAAPVRARRRRDLPRQGRGDRRRSCSCSRCVLARRRRRALRRRRSARVAPLVLRDRWPRPSVWRPPVPSTACSRPGSGCARRWCRCCCSRSVTPVMLGATRAWEAAIDGVTGGRVAVGRAARRRSRCSSVAVGHARVRAAAGGSVSDERDTRRRRLLSPRSPRCSAGPRSPRWSCSRCSGSGARRPTRCRATRSASCTCTCRRRGSRTSRSASPRSRRCSGSGRGPASPVWDRLAGASAEVGVVFTGLTLVLGLACGAGRSGASGGRGTPGSSRTAVLFFLYLGYLALRRIRRDRRPRAKRCAIAALIAFVDVPIVHFSVTWWRTLHQQATVFNPRARTRRSTASMAFTLLVRRPRVHARSTLPCSTAATGSRRSRRTARSASSSRRSPSGSPAQGRQRRAIESRCGSDDRDE